jgi:hypothetical protein
MIHEINHPDLRYSIFAHSRPSSTDSEAFASLYLCETNYLTIGKRIRSNTAYAVYSEKFMSDTD